MGGRFVDGTWFGKDDWENSETGEFKRQTSQFRSRIHPGGEFPVEPNRYHLYVSLACPWAHRTLMVRALMGLEDCISVSTVHPLMTDEGWHFDKEDKEFPSPDDLYGCTYLREIYLKAEPRMNGRVTVPVLWDKETRTIVSNESSEIIRDLAIHFQALGTRQSDLYPAHLRNYVDTAMNRFYEPVNNGVYRCGFAGSQEAYEQNLDAMFLELNHWNDVLENQPYVAGEQLTIADLALFATLLRFDPVYYVHFKTCKKHIYEFPGLWRLVCELINHPLIRPTVSMGHIKHHYFRSHPHINPTGFVPPGPELEYTQST